MIKNKIFIKAVILTGLILGSTAAFAGNGLVSGATDPCEQLWLVNDPGNAYLDPNAGGECIDVPVNLKKVNVLFNLDNAITKTSPVAIKDEAGNIIGKTMVTSPVGLRHMALLGKVMQYRISQGLIDPANISIVGIFHGDAMSGEKWPFKNGMPDHVKKWVDTIFKLKKAGINIQLEVCGVTLKGMQKKMKEFNNPMWAMMDERAIYSNEDGRILVNQGAVGRIIELQTARFAYLQEE